MLKTEYTLSEFFRHVPNVPGVSSFGCTTFAPGLNLRTVMREGAPWFVATDVCAVLELTGYASQHTASLCRDEVVVVTKPRVSNMSLAPLFSGKTPCVALVSESGLYSLILKSRKPEARSFKKWVTSVVLPAIRKDGAYVMGDIPSVLRTSPGWLRTNPGANRGDRSRLPSVTLKETPA